MNQILDTVLLLALPASGKSEVRRYLELMPEEARRRDFHMGPSVQLDDYPYVHMMRRIDDELSALGQARIFFRSSQHPFINPLDWGTLIQLVNQDYQGLLRGHANPAGSASRALFARIDDASVAAGAPARLGVLPETVLAPLAETLEAESRKTFDDLIAVQPSSLAGKTLVIEFARGGGQGSTFPLQGGFGYHHSLSQLSPEILEKATILYIWVTPEESRRKNDARAHPDDPGSILHHGVPIEVMLNDYGVCDMEYLLEQTEKPGCVTVKAHGRTFHLPMARFDNRQDKTSFLREEQALWKESDVKAIHDGMHEALDHLARTVRTPVS